jgi:hypothetical protein
MAKEVERIRKGGRGQGDNKHIEHCGTLNVFVLFVLYGSHATDHYMMTSHMG